MKVGDLVTRSNKWKEWVRHNSWMEEFEEKEVGIVVRFEYKDKTMAVILWSQTGVSYESAEDLEAV